MLRPVLILDLPEAVRTKLQASGYEYVEDIEKALSHPEDFPAQLKTILETYRIPDKLKSLNSTSEISSIASLWHSEFYNQPVAVFHQGLDKLLDGGFPVGRITELCGPPGSGKTQMCLQFCVDVQIPAVLGGSAAEALYITTDFGFGVRRLKEIIQASVQHCSTLNFRSKKEKRKILRSFTPESLLNGVNVVKTTELNELVEAVKSLEGFVSVNPKIKLVIIDSFSLPFVTELEDFLVRSKIIAEMMDVLLRVAMKHKLAVVLTNQLMTIVTQNNKFVLKPSLGEGFGHRLHQRLLLDEGKIYLTKSIHHKQLYTRFEITKDGIR